MIIEYRWESNIFLKEITKLIIFCITLLLPLFAQATLYEDAEDGDIIGNVPPNVRGWFVYDNTPAGAVISNVVDAQKGRVIQFAGAAGTPNGYMLGDWYPTSAGTWNNTSEFNINWCSKYSQNFVMYMRVYTANDLIYTDSGGVVRNHGKHRYIYYTAINTDSGVHTTSPWYIHHGLGLDKRDGTWHSLARDMQADLQEYEPTNTITSVVGFLIRASGRVDDIELTALPKKPSISLKKTTKTVYDPVNLLVNPKAIPGAMIEYVITANNSSNGAADNNFTNIEDKVPSNMKLCVSTVGQCVAPNIGVINTSGLSIGSIQYSNNNGTTFNYTPTADINGHDSSVTNLRYQFNGRFLGSCGLDRSIELKMRMGLK